MEEYSEQLTAITETLVGLKATLEAQGGESGGYIITALAAFAGAGIAAFIHYTASRQALKGSVIVQARKVWMESLRDELSTFITDASLVFVLDEDANMSKQRIYASYSRLTLRLTPDARRERKRNLLADKHGELEKSLEKALALAVEVIDLMQENNVASSQVSECLNEKASIFGDAVIEVRDHGRDILYGTWLQIRKEIEEETKPFPMLRQWVGSMNRWLTRRAEPSSTQVTLKNE